MATVRIQQNILDNKVDTFSVESGITIETLIREHTDGDTYSSTLVECYDLETGKTYFAPIEEDSGSLNAIVQVNGKDEGLDYTLKENDIVAIVITPASGGGSSSGISFEWGWDWGGALAGMVSGMLVGAVYGAGLPGLIIGGVVGFVGGGLLVGSVKATIDSMKAKDIKSTSGIDSERLPDVRGATNQPLLDQSYPFVIGKHLVAPFIIGSPWNEISGKHGETNYIHVLYAVGYAPLRITDIKLGDMFLAHNQRWADNKDMKNIFHGALTGIDSGNNSKGIDYYQSNTTIDLRNRPLVDSETMNTAGWDVEEGEVATVYSCAYSNQDETKTVLVTPILSNGTVLTPVQTETYANQLLNNETISVDILLNTFTGSDSIAQSDEYAEGLHNSQATYYGLNGDIVNTWANNDITVEILQQGQNGQAIDYGTVYPHAKIQQDINANSLYIADGSLEEIDSGNNISYKGLGLKNGLRNNPIRFTEQFAKSAKIELDFNNGLYKSRSETSGDNSEQKYYKIPMWVALQWRVYSEENDETDGSVSGELPLPTYDPITKTYLSAKRGWNSFSILNESVSVSLYTEDARYKDIQAHTGNHLRNVGPSSTVTEHKGRYHYEFRPKIYEKDGVVREILLDHINEWTFITGEDLRSSVQSVNDIVNLDCHYDHDIDGRRNCILWADFSVIQKETHTTEVYDADINKGWINANVFNLEELGGTNSDQDGINEFRCSTELDFVEWARYSLLTAEERASADVEQILAEKFRAYFYDGSNTTKSVEVRVVRVSPCYIDETTSNKDHSAFKFNDVFTWTTLTSTMLNGDKLTKEGVIEQRRPISEERMRKLCVLSLRAKTDNVDQLTNTIKKLSCIAQSFSPYYNEETKQWSPVSVTKVKKYYKPAEKVDKNGNRGASAAVPPFTWEPGPEITEQQFYEDRQNGIKSTCVPAGNNFVPQMVNNIIRTVNHKDHKNRYYIPYDDMDNGSYKADCDGTLNYCKNLTSSMFILAGIGPQLGIDALGYEQNFYSNSNLKAEVGDFDMNALAKWNEEVKCVKDGSFYTSDGYHYNERGERVHHVAGEEVEMYFAANAYVYQPDLLENILAKIAVAGRAVYTRDAKGRITVIMDKPEKYPVALINQQNTLKSSYTLSFEELPAGLQIVFPDENDGYEQNNFYCMRDGENADNPRGAIEQYRFDFVTNNYQQNSLGNYLLANRILNREVVSKQMGIEGASIGLGNLVLVSDDTMLIGTDTGARITKLIEDDEKVYGFIINNSYKYTGEEEVVDGVLVCKQGVMVMQPSQYKEYKVITLRLATANTVVTVDEVDYQLKKGNTNVVLFNVPIVKTRDVESGDFYYYRPEVDNLVSFGIVGKITATYRVIKVKGNNNHTFDFTLSKYQEDLYTSGRALPSFQNNMSIPDRSDEDSYALSENVKQADLVKAITESSEQASGMIDAVIDGSAEIGSPSDVSYITAVAKENVVELVWNPIASNGLSNVIKQYHVQISKNSGDTWTDIVSTFESSYSYTFVRSGVGSDGYPEAADLNNWRFRVRAENVYGYYSEHFTVAEVNVNNYGTWIPATPSFSTKIPDEGGIVFTWQKPDSSISGKTLYGTQRYTVTVKYADSDHSVPEQTLKTIVTNGLSVTYNFNRASNKDGYPEKVATEDYKGLNKYIFILSVENESGNTPVASTAVTFTQSEIDNYKTWIPSAPVITKQLAEENGITFEWNDVSDCYGNNHYTIAIPDAEGSIPQSLGATRFYYTFLRSANNVVKDGYPEPDELIDWDFTVKAVNNQTSRESTGSTDYVDVSEYLGWLPNSPVVQSRSSGRTCTLMSTNAEQRYGKIMYKVLVCNPAIDRVEAGGETTYKYYLPTPTADPFGEETNYKNGSQENVPILSDSPYSQTMPLKDQTATKYKKYSFVNATDPLDYDDGTMKLLIYTETQPPVSATQHDVYIDGVLVEDAYCWTESGTNFISFEVSMPSPKDTIYWWKVASYNAVTESIQTKTSAYASAQTTAFATSTFDVVKAGITENALAPDAVTTDKIAAGTITANKIFVEALSAISANLGAITDGSLVGNANNYWYLSDEYNEQHQLIHRAGDFRVGGATGDFISCSTSNGTDYNIEIQASQFNITAIGTVVKGVFYVSPTDATINPNTGKPNKWIAELSPTAGVSINGSFKIGLNYGTGTSSQTFFRVDADDMNPRVSMCGLHNEHYNTQWWTCDGRFTTEKAFYGRGYVKTFDQLDLSDSTVFDQNKWYPVTFEMGAIGDTEVECYVSLDSGTNPSWSTSNRGFSCHLHLIVMGGSNVGLLDNATNGRTLVLNHDFRYTQTPSQGNPIDPCGWTQMYNSGTGVLWLRGGGAYKVWNSKNAEFTIRTSTYSKNGETVSPSSTYKWSIPYKANMTGDIDGHATSSDTSKNSVSLDGYAECLTVASAQAKTVSLKDFVLNKGAKINVFFQNDNSYQGSITLNVQNTGPKTIKYNGIVTSSSYYNMVSGFMSCYYDGTYWCVENTYESISSRIASKLETTRTINGTNFDGSGNITTSKWGTARNISISDSDGTHTGTAVSVDGSAAKTLKLPSTISADITGKSKNALNAFNTVAYCTTASATAAKTAELNGFYNNTSDPLRFILFMAYDNTADDPTLSINGTQALYICDGDTDTPHRTKIVPAGIYLVERPDGFSNNRYFLHNIVNMSTSKTFNQNREGAPRFFGAPAVTAWNFSADSGYIVYLNGLIIQWGILSETNNFKDGRTIQLPISYTTSFAVTADWKFAGQNYLVKQVYPSDKSHIVLRGDAVSTLSNQSPVSWFTIGY